MINTFLFDLDGTLLPLKLDLFEREYFRRLAAKLHGHFEPDSLVKNVLRSTMKMVANTGGLKTNEQVFYEDFIASTGKDISVLEPIFNEFYLNEFNELSVLARTEKNILDSVNILIERGYELVIATNPIFPLQAIKARISWAGLDESSFKFITCFEKMHYCKPNPEFYREVLKVIGKRAEECIMVGNDTEEDLAASILGIKTFLIEDYIINRDGRRPPADFIGSYKDFYSFVKDNFPALKMAGRGL